MFSKNRWFILISTRIKEDAFELRNFLYMKNSNFRWMIMRGDKSAIMIGLLYLIFIHTHTKLTNKTMNQLLLWIGFSKMNSNPRLIHYLNDLRKRKFKNKIDLHIPKKIYFLVRLCSGVGFCCVFDLTRSISWDDDTVYGWLVEIAFEWETVYWSLLISDSRFLHAELDIKI